MSATNQTELTSLFNEAVTISTFSIAKIMQILTAGQYVYVGKTKTWFQFIGHRYQEMYCLAPLSKLIRADIRNMYLEFIKAAKPEDTKVQMFLLNKFDSTAFQKSCIKEFAELVYDVNFSAKLDVNPRLLCCRNGVIDLTTGHFRPGQQSDYCSLSTKLKYTPLADVPATQILELDQILNKIYPQAETKELFLQCAFDMLTGNVNKCLYILEGHDNSAKSTIVKLLSATLGKYFWNIPNDSVRETLTGVRVAHFIDLREKEDLTSQNLRVMGSRSYAPLIVTDSAPAFLTQDVALKYRHKIIKHVSLFVTSSSSNSSHTVEPDEVMQFKTLRFPADTQLYSQIADYAPVLLAMLIQRFQN